MQITKLHSDVTMSKVSLAGAYEKLWTVFARRPENASGTATGCRMQFKPGQHGIEASIDCAGCESGKSSITDPVCRRGVLKGLSYRRSVDRLLMKRDFVREYSGDNLDIILGMASFCDDIRVHGSTLTSYGCGNCDAQRQGHIKDIEEMAAYDPIGAIGLITTIQTSIRPGRNIGECRKCVESYASFIRDLAYLGRRLGAVSQGSYAGIDPYVMPRFSSSKILVSPPQDSVFIRSYDVDGDGFTPPLHVSIYELPESLEKLYFIVPWEYAMDEAELSVIVEAREQLLKKRPDETDFLEETGARSFFTRNAKESIVNATKSRSLPVDISMLERLTGTLVRYTCGLGILEDILRDPHIQDAYVNVPVGLNPLHVVVDGEECTSNVFLSESDVESMISRLRAISGRPFSEASPVLDMDLGEFHTRVSVIGNPLTKGLAYAFRRHKRTPWTLPQLVHSNMLSPYCAGLLSFLVDGQSSILVTGSRGAGKTSLLSALMLEIPQCYRILVIEDTPELPVEDMQRYGWKAQGIGTRASVSGSEAEFRASDALRAALRLGESALVIGEVRGTEAHSLYEAMRVGASGNSVMGTIHGASCRDIFERVVHDIGVPRASFKATDIVVVCSTIRAGGSVSRQRRVIQVSEVVKGQWDDDDVDSIFNSLLEYDAAEDMLLSTDRIDTGRSESIRSIAKRWGIKLEDANMDIGARAEVLKTIADAGSGSRAIMEMGSYARSMNMFRVITDRNRREHGSVDHDEVIGLWKKWFSREMPGGA